MKPPLLVLPDLCTTLYYFKLRLNFKSPSKLYLTVVNYRLFSKVKINSAIIFALKTLFSVDDAMNPITENVLDTLL